MVLPQLIVRLYATALSLLFAIPLHAAGLDSSFGTAGRFILELLGGQSSQAAGALLQPDGKIVVVGTSPGVDDTADLPITALDATRDFLIVRFNADGSLDSTFGSGGIVSVDFGHGDDRATAVARQPDGKLIVVGQALSERGTDFDVAVARLTPDGNLDSSFNGSGKTTVNVKSTVVYPSFAVVTNLDADNEPRSLELTPDGKLLITSLTGDLRVQSRPSTSFLQVIRLLADGTLDPSFGTQSDGVLNMGAGTLPGLVTRPNGEHLLFAGAQVWDIDPDGHGIVGHEIYGSAAPWFSTVGLLQPDGRLLLGGTAFDSTNFANPVGAVGRMNSDLTIDSAYGVNGGISTFAPSSTTGNTANIDASVTGLLMEPDGKVIATRYDIDGSNYFRTFVSRLLPDGQNDTNFGNSGSLGIDFGSVGQQYSFTAVSTLRANSGKLLLVGTRGQPATSQFGDIIPGYIDARSKRIVLSQLTSTPEYDIAQPDVVVLESAGTIALTVTRSGASTAAVKVDYATADGSATAGADYAATSGTLTWQPGDADAQVISIPIYGGHLHDGSKRSFSLELSSPSEGSIKTRKANISIAEDDPVRTQSGGGGSFEWLSLSLLAAYTF